MMIDLSFFLFYNYIGDKMKKVIMFILLSLLVTGCTSNDNLKFKKEYEKLNDSLYNITISEDNYIKYIDINEVLNIIKKGTGVIYIGNEHDNECRQMVNILFDAADSTDLKTINYYKATELTELNEYVDNPQVPLVLFVYEGEIKSYKQGIGNNENLTPDEKDELFNIYLDGIHEVLNDICEEECND